MRVKKLQNKTLVIVIFIFLYFSSKHLTKFFPKCIVITSLIFLPHREKKRTENTMNNLKQVNSNLFATNHTYFLIPNWSKTTPVNMKTSKI